MKIAFSEDKTLCEPKLVLHAARRDEQTETVLSQLERLYADTVNAYRDECVYVLRQSDILRVWAEGAHVFCQAGSEIYSLHARLWEMEERLDAQTFVRISKWEIVNKNKILRLDVSLVGTVGVTLEGNVKTNTSRRYMKTIKAVFGL